jgi:hypothetical protein
MMLVGSLVSITAAFPIFWLFNTGTTAGVFLALVVAMPIAHSCVYATVSGFIATLFGPQIRFTGTSMAYQLGGIVASAPAPILATMLYTEFNSYVAVAVYLVFTNVVAFVAVLFAPRDKAGAKTGPVSPVVGAQSPHDLEEAR